MEIWRYGDGDGQRWTEMVIGMEMVMVMVIGMELVMVIEMELVMVIEMDIPTLATRCLWPEPYGMAARSSVPGGHGMMALTEAPFPLVA